MNDAQLLRYSRHILLPEIGIEGQQNLLEARALIVGVGGLGSPIALYLAASGVGKIVLADDDVVELNNLQRQIVHNTAALGINKTLSAKATLSAINPEIEIHTLTQRVDAALLPALVARADVVLDASDNFATRHSINRACIAHEKPLVSGAAVRWDGQVSVFNLNKANSPCYACLFPEAPYTEEMRCAENGVLSPLVGIVGSIQAAEALKLLMHVGDPLSGRLLLIEALSMNFRSVKLHKDPTCPACTRQ